MRTDKVIAIHGLLANADTSTLTPSERINLVRILRVMRPTVEEMERHRVEAESTLLPKDVKDIREGKIDFNALPDEEKTKIESQFLESNRLIQESLEDVLLKDIDINIPTITTDTLQKLLEANTKWNISQMDLLIEVLGIEIF